MAIVGSQVMLNSQKPNVYYIYLKVIEDYRHVSLKLKFKLNMQFSSTHAHKTYWNLFLIMVILNSLQIVLILCLGLTS